MKEEFPVLVCETTSVYRAALDSLCMGVVWMGTQQDIGSKRKEEK